MNCAKYSRVVAVLAVFMIPTLMLGQGTAPIHSVYNAYWSTEGGFQALAQLHNNLVNEGLTVRPVLYTSSGDSIALDPVTLIALGNATIDIGAELAAKGWANLGTGSAIFEYERKFAGALGAEVYMGNASKSLSFTIPSTQKPPASATQHAVFWLPSSKAEVYVALQNTSDQPIHISTSMTVSGQTVPLSAASLPPFGSSVFSVSKSGGSAWQRGSAGSITVTQDGPQGALNTGGWIEDDDPGFSTTITFSDPAGKGKPNRNADTRWPRG